MNNVFGFDGYSEFCGWCDQYGYDPDDLYDETEESHKRDTYLTFYVKNTRYAEPIYAEVCFWFRIFGYGLTIINRDKQSAPSAQFSVRSGNVKEWRVGK